MSNRNTSFVRFYNQIINLKQPNNLVAKLTRFVDLESNNVRRKDGCVQNQKQYDPIPDGLERRVMENSAFWDRCLSVFKLYRPERRQNVSVVLSRYS